MLSFFYNRYSQLIDILWIGITIYMYQVFIVSKWTLTKSRPISYAVISHNKQNKLHYKGSNSAWSLNQSFKYKVRVHYWSGTSAECPDGFVTHGQSCYHFSHDQETWLDAVVSVQEYIIQSKKDKPLNKT